MKKTRKTPPKGRPTLAVQREKKLPTRFSEAELDVLRSRAEAACISLADYVRGKLGLPTTGYGSPTQDLRRKKKLP
jgi:hypothetical protein